MSSGQLRSRQIPGTHQPLAALRYRIGAARYDAACARGAAADYDEIVAFMLSTFDHILVEYL